VSIQQYTNKGDTVKLLTKEVEKKLLNNHQEQAAFMAQTEGDTIEMAPVVKLFDAYGSAFWLLTEMDEHGLAFGLADLGLGFPELGVIDVNEIIEVNQTGPFPRIERDRYFTATKSLSEYLNDAKAGVRP
jgi:hypothetical protein